MQETLIVYDKMVRHKKILSKKDVIATTKLMGASLIKIVDNLWSKYTFGAKNKKQAMIFREKIRHKIVNSTSRNLGKTKKQD